MTDTSISTGADSDAGVDVTPSPRPAARSTSRAGSVAHGASIVFFGNLVWLGWLWAVLLVLLPIVLLIIDGAGGELSNSLWSDAGLGWQRWVLFAAGVQTTVTFLRMFVTRGVTRRTLARSSLVAMVMLSAIGSGVGVVGYLIERWLFREFGWPQIVSQFGPLELADLGRLALEHLLLMSVYYLAGWLVGAAFTRVGAPFAIPAIPLALVPVAILEFSVSRGAGGANIDVLPEVFDDPSLVLSLGIGAVVLVATAVVADRVTRSLPVR